MEKSTFFKELTPLSRTYELRCQGGGGKKNTRSKTNKHLTLSYKKASNAPLNHYHCI